MPKKIRIRRSKDGKLLPGQPSLNPKGRGHSPNKVTTAMKEAILLAASEEGDRLKAAEGSKLTFGGLTGYMEMLAAAYPKTYAGLLAKLLPYVVHNKTDREQRDVYETLEQVQKRLREKGVPLREVEKVLQLEHMPMDDDETVH